jgi:pimeloyl-ACP methyl ester carboxylesterase
MQIPDVRYARCDDLSIAYRVLGTGPVDVVEVPPLIAHLEATWDEPSFAAFVERVARFARLIVFDKRGTGLSDRIAPGAEPGFERRAEDVRAVIDAAGTERAALIGIADGGLVAMAFAATYPERTSALVLFCTGPGGRAMLRGGLGTGLFDLAEAQRGVDQIEQAWGTGVMVIPFGETDEVVRERLARMERQTCTPRVAGAYMRALLDADLRPLLPSIRTPTLVIHNRDHPLWPVDGGRYLAANIRGARYLEYAEGFGGFFDQRERTRLAADIAEFLTGTRVAGEADRVLATVLYTDIVGSTERLAAMGDGAWRGLLAEHERTVRTAARVSGGTLVKSLGDGSSCDSRRRRQHFAAPGRSCARPSRRGSTFARVSTRANAKSATTTSSGSRFTSGRA